jgi:uncharacterized protein (DUF2236 family)
MKESLGTPPVLQGAVVPTEPAGPNRPMWAGVAAAVGVLAGLVAARAMSALSPRFAAPFEVEAYAGLPVLASISRINRTDN